MPRPRSRPPREALAFGAVCRPERVLPVLLAAGLLFAASQTLALPAAPTLRREYGTGPGATAWVLTAFLLSAAVATPVVGALGDRFGKGRVLTWVLVVFAAGAVVSATAGDLGVLIAGRAVQGVAGGVVPLAFGVVREFFPADRVSGGLAAVTAVFGVGGGCGLALSGVVIDRLGVSWLFWLGLVALPAALAAHRWVPPSPPGRPRQVDWRGALLLGGALSGCLLAVTQATQVAQRVSAAPLALAAAVAAGVLLHLWRRVERDARAPAGAAAGADRPPGGRDPPDGAADRHRDVRRPAARHADRGGAPRDRVQAGRHRDGRRADPAPVRRRAARRRPGRRPARHEPEPHHARAGRRARRDGVRPARRLPRRPLAAGRRWLPARGGNGLALAALADLVAGAVDDTEVTITIGVHMVVRTVGGAIGAVLSTALLELTATATGSPTPAGYTAGFVLLAGSALLAVGAAGLVPRPGEAVLVRVATASTAPRGTGGGRVAS